MGVIVHNISSHEPCPCGSGKKYKQCCQQRETPVANNNLPPGTIQTALEHHQAGRLPEAEAIYRQILQEEPNHADALHYLGAIASHEGRHGIAVELIGKAVSINPSRSMYYNLGNALQALGKLDEAVESYRRALALKPDYAEAFYNLGNALHAQGKLDSAAESYQKALALRPDYVKAFYNMANKFKARDQQCYVEVFCNLGNALQAQDKLDAAAESYRMALALKPGYVVLYNNLGNILDAQGKLDTAVESYRMALALKPDYVDAYSNLGSTLRDQGKLNEAVTCFQKALALKPSFAEVHYNLGNTLKDQGKLDEAVICYRKALALKPDFTDVHNNLGNTLKDQGKLDAAVESYRKALSLKPDDGEVYSNLLFAMQYSPKYTPLGIFTEHLHFAEQFEAPLKPFWPVHKNARESKKRLKVGYVSGDFRNHAVAYFIEPILTNHDKSQVEVFCYSNHPAHDSITDRLIAVTDHWIPCKGLSDEQLAEHIRSDGIDILVDLSGHTAHNRLLTFARKPAPIQVTWLGYPGTTGLAAMDYRLTDGYMDPVGMTEQYHTETLLRLPSSATFQPSAESPPVNALPALTSNQFTLACLNNLAKINQDAIRLWAHILVALPHARLMLGNATDEQTRQKLIDMFAQEGIGAERLVLHPKMPLSEYLALHHQIDLALDTFPYNGGTSTCHSLWMGVPVITLAGNNTAARQGVAVMEGVGLTEFVTASGDEYVERVLEFSRDLPKLNQIRQSLRERMATQSGADPLQLTRSLEDAFRNLWEKWCNG